MTMIRATVQRQLRSVALIAILGGCGNGVEEGGYAFMTHDRFVAVTIARSGSMVNWVVVRAWAADSRPEDRWPDQRFIFGTRGSRQILVGPGQYAPLGGDPAIYVLDGPSVVSFRMRPVSEDEFPVFAHEPTMHFAEVVAALKRLELQ